MENVSGSLYFEYVSMYYIGRLLNTLTIPHKVETYLKF